MVAAITGILMGIGTLLSYGGYNIITSLNGNNSIAANNSQVREIHSNQSNNATDGVSLPLNNTTNIEEIFKLNDIENSSFEENILPVLTPQKPLNKESGSEDETQHESSSIHKDIEVGESDILMGRELNYEKEFNRDEVEINQNNNRIEVQNPKLADVTEDNEIKTDEIKINQENNFLEFQSYKLANVTEDNKSKTDETVYQKEELDSTVSPQRLNPKLTLNINNLKNLEKGNSVNRFDLEPFPSVKKEGNTNPNIDYIPENPLYKKYHEAEHEPFPSVKKEINTNPNIDFIPENPLYKNYHEAEHKVQVKNPLYPIPKKSENQHQENEFHLNKIDSPSYENINPNVISNHNSNEDNMDKEIYSFENIKSNVNKPEAESIVTEESLSGTLQPAMEELIDSLVSKNEILLEEEVLNSEEEVLKSEEGIIKSFLGNTEVISEDMNVKTLFISYAEIAGIVVASVLIVTGLVFLSIRQAMKYRRQSKIQKRYAESECGRVNTLTYAYTNEVEVE